MSDDATSTSTAAESASNPGPAAAALETVQQPSQDTGISAPTVSREREVADAIKAGRPIQELIAEARSGRQGGGAAATPAQAATPASGTPATSTDASGNATADETGYGLDPKDLAALKRAKFDMEALKHIPPANRKAIARNFAASQAEIDRQFTLARQGKLAQGEAGATQQGEQTSSTSDAATPTGDQQPTEQQADAGQEATERTATQEAQRPANPLSVFQLDPKDRATLEEIGGRELAETQQKLLSSVTEHVFEKHVKPLASLVQFFVNREEEREFKGAVAELRKQPGMEQLSDEQIAQIRQRVPVLLRAAGNPEAYEIANAVSDAAASLFRQNFHQAAQQRLASAKTTSLAGAGVRPNGQAAAAQRPRTEADRYRAIAKAMLDNPGIRPADARAMVDAA